MPSKTHWWFINQEISLKVQLWSNNLENYFLFKELLFNPNTLPPPSPHALLSWIHFPNLVTSNYICQFSSKHCSGNICMEFLVLMASGRWFDQGCKKAWKKIQWEIPIIWKLNGTKWAAFHRQVIWFFYFFHIRVLVPEQQILILLGSFSKIGVWWK